MARKVTKGLTAAHRSASKKPQGRQRRTPFETSVSILFSILCRRQLYNPSELHTVSFQHLVIFNCGWVQIQGVPCQPPSSTFSQKVKSASPNEFRRGVTNQAHKSLASTLETSCSQLPTTSSIPVSGTSDVTVDPLRGILGSSNDTSRKEGAHMKTPLCHRSIIIVAFPISKKTLVRAYIKDIDRVSCDFEICQNP